MGSFVVPPAGGGSGGAPTSAAYLLDGPVPASLPNARDVGALVGALTIAGNADLVLSANSGATDVTLDAAGVIDLGQDTTIQTAGVGDGIQINVQDGILALTCSNNLIVAAGSAGDLLLSGRNSATQMNLNAAGVIELGQATTIQTATGSGHSLELVSDNITTLRSTGIGVSVQASAGLVSIIADTDATLLASTGDTKVQSQLGVVRLIADIAEVEINNATMDCAAGSVSLEIVGIADGTAADSALAVGQILNGRATILLGNNNVTGIAVDPKFNGKPVTISLNGVPAGAIAAVALTFVGVVAAGVLTITAYSNPGIVATAVLFDVPLTYTAFSL